MKKFVSFVLVLCIAISLFAITAAACSNCTSDSFFYRAVADVRGNNVNIRVCHKLNSNSLVDTRNNKGLNSGDDLVISRAYVAPDGTAWFYVTVKTCSKTPGNVGLQGWMREDVITIDYSTEEMKIGELYVEN